MRKTAILICAFLATAVFGLHTAFAQFPKIPRIPKTSQPKPTPDSAAQPSSGAGPTSQPSRPAAAADGAASTAAGEDQPSVIKTSVIVDVSREYRGGDDSFGWLPTLSFNVNGPIASGSQLYAEFSQPTGGVWVKFDCETNAVRRGAWLHTQCGGREISNEKATTYTGPVNFSIKMRNELAGTPDLTLFKGTAKVGKAPTADGPKKPNYYVDQDWRLPLGYVWLESGNTPLAESAYPQLRVGFWVRGYLGGAPSEPHLFYQGKEVGVLADEGKQYIGSCNSPRMTTDYDKAYHWEYVVCDFTYVYGWDKTGERRRWPPHLLSEHPGEYEFKLLWKNHLSRSIKFSVDSTGNIVDTPGGVVRVQVLGSEDGNWDRNAWRTDAFYGNPLTGFTPPQ